MFFPSCKTTQVENPCVIYYFPRVNFPQFPELGKFEILEDGRVAVDENYFRQLLVFRTLYDSEVEKYNVKKEFLKEERK